MFDKQLLQLATAAIVLGCGEKMHYLCGLALVKSLVLTATV